MLKGISLSTTVTKLADFFSHHIVISYIYEHQNVCTKKSESNHVCFAEKKLCHSKNIITVSKISEYSTCSVHRQPSHVHLIFNSLVN